MDSIQNILDTAVKTREIGQNEKALELYNDAFNLLIEAAGKYAQELEGSIEDPEKLRSLAPVLFAHANTYLKRDLLAAQILNAMGVIFGEINDDHNAKQKFEEALSYVPDNTSYDDPRLNLEVVSNRLMTSQTPSDEE